MNTPESAAADRVKQLFAEAIELPPAERGAFVAAACTRDEPLRRRLDLLLRAHDIAGDFLEHPVSLVAAAADQDPADADDGLAPGDRIGAHQLVERLGRGGFGTVWRARQLAPVERDVAMKILHCAGDRVLRWFVAERQTLARMQHPGIASMFDAGTTDDGRPWLTMQLVDGEPITRFCDRHAVPLRTRLALFADVCLAVQHAHVKGVVHHDVKPANVLVTERDGALRPVVIDFGVAHALDDATAARDDAAAPPGTPDYMSPEQAADDRGAVDARTDVYSLGVLLYELCSGRRPHPKGVGQGALRELLRAIREDEPPPPSTVCAGRLPRELDWVVARAMAKNPAQRYPTAAALADDVRRLLDHEPLAAGPDSTPYRLRKFARRHRVVVAAVATILLSLATGVAVAARGWYRASEAERLARLDQLAAEQASRRATRALDLLDELWTGADPSRLGRADYPARELLADCARELPLRAAGEPEVELRVRRLLARLQSFLGYTSNAEQHADRAVELARAGDDARELLLALVQRARVRFLLADVDGAQADLVEATALEAALPAREPAIVASIDEFIARCAQRRGEPEAALSAAERALVRRRALGGPAEIAKGLLLLANLHGSVGRIQPAMAAVEEALALQTDLGDDHPDVLAALQHRAFLLQRQRDFGAAEAAFRDGLERRRRTYGAGHPLVAWAEADLAWVLHERGRDGDAEPLLRSALPVLRERLGEGHLFVTETMQRLGAVLIGCGRTDEAEILLVEAVERCRTLDGHPREGLVGALANLANLRWQQGHRDTGVALMQDAVDVAVAALPAEHYLVSVTMTNLAWLLAENGDRERAVGLLHDARRRAQAGGRAREVELQRQRLVGLLRELGRADEADTLERDGR